MSGAQVIEAMLLRWSEGPAGRTVTFLLPDEPGTSHAFKGLPSGRVNGQRVALSVALIGDDETQTDHKPRRNWSELTPAEQAGIRCGEPAFRKFLVAKSLMADDDTDTPADAVRRFCEVKSRSDLKPGTDHARWWHKLNSQFQVWMQDAAA